MFRRVAAFAALALATPLSPAWAQATLAQPGAPPLKPATAAQIRGLKGLYPKPQMAVGTDTTAPADTAYYACLAQRLHVPLSRMIERPTPLTKERVSALIASRAQASNCAVAGDGRDYIGIKPVLTLEATARYAETWKPPRP